MKRKIHSENLLFQVTDVFGRSVRTTRDYWEKITHIKHRELTIEISDVVKTLEYPDEVYESIQDPYIKLFYKKSNGNGGKYLVVLVKYIQESGFVVTCYQTTKTKRKGVQVWPK